MRTSVDMRLDVDGWWSGGRIRRGPLRIGGHRIVPASRARARGVDLRGHLAFPGLVNAHDHLHVNSVPPLRAVQPFANSYAWIDAFQAHFNDPVVVAALGVPKSVRLRHGALKNLLAGTTFVVHHDPWHPEMDRPDFPVAVLRDFGWSYTLGGPDYGPPVRASFAATPPGRPWMIHLAEGTDAVARAELDRLGRMGCLAPNSVLVHAVGLDAAGIGRVIEAGASVVWCPGSNRSLLGVTLDPEPLLAAGRLMLGTDSRLSGERDLLEELRRLPAGGALGPSRLLALVTVDAARLLGISDRGHLHAGALADLVVVEDRGGDPAGNLVGRSRAEIRAVVRGGLPRIADPDLADWFELAGIDTVQVRLDGRPKLMDRHLASPEVLALEPGLAGGSVVPMRSCRGTVVA